MAHTVALIASIALALGILISVPIGTDAARILGFFPSQSPSHLLIHCAIADTLAEAGHNVTVVANAPNAYKKAKYHYIQVNTPAYGKEFLNNLVNKPMTVYGRFLRVIIEATRLANETLAHTEIQNFLNTYGEGSFDLLIMSTVVNDFFVGLSEHFKCPIVGSFVVQPIFTINTELGNPSEPAYVPTLLSGLRQPMGFWARVENFICSNFELYALGGLIDYREQKFYDYHFPADRYAPLEEVRKNISLIFVNHHSVSQGPIRPNVPNLIEIGGIQIKEKPDPLPADIAKLLDESKEGVIYFSLGSNIQGGQLTADKAHAMFRVLSKLPYKVLWKWSNADYPGQSPNIIYKSWLPQDDILAHPNMKLFITHCGQGSVVESQYHGVPMVGIPLFGDQPANAANMEQAGFGLSVDYITLTEASLNTAVQEVLHNKKYTEAVRAFSKLYRDRPMTARQSVRYWVDYVLRHNGAKHLQSPAVHLNRWQLLSLDVIAFLLAIVAIVVGVVVKLCALMFCRSKSKAPRARVNKSKK